MSRAEATAEVFLTAFRALAQDEKEAILSRLWRETPSSKRTYDEEYLSNLIRKATPTWQGIENPDRWLRDMRGYAD